MTDNLMNSYDGAGLTVFLFGAIYGTVNRLFKTSPFALNQQLKLSLKKCLVGIIFSMFFFPYVTIVLGILPSLAACNVLTCMVFSIIGCLLTHLAIDRNLEHQTVLFSTIAVFTYLDLGCGDYLTCPRYHTESRSTCRRGNSGWHHCHVLL